MVRFANPAEYSWLDLEVASILVPEPDLSSVPEEAGNEVYAAWAERLQDCATEICLVRQNDGDPLIAELESLRRRRTEIEQQMILLVAYMREKVKPRPYTLQQIANAAGMSISGTRTFYDSGDVELLEERIAAAKHALRPPNRPASAEPAGRAADTVE